MNACVRGVCVYVHESNPNWPERGIRFPSARVTGYEPLEVGAGNPTLVLCKSEQQAPLTRSTSPALTLLASHPDLVLLEWAGGVASLSCLHLSNTGDSAHTPIFWWVLGSELRSSCLRVKPFTVELFPQPTSHFLIRFQNHYRGQDIHSPLNRFESVPSEVRAHLESLLYLGVLKHPRQWNAEISGFP